MKYIILTSLILIFSLSAYSQSPYKDHFVTIKNDTIKCMITKLEAGEMTFFNASDNKKSKQNINGLVDLYISEERAIKNPLNLKIQKPDSGYAHVYFYRPYVFLNSALPCKIQYQNKKFINIKTNSYHLEKIKAETKHLFIKKRLFKDNIVEIDAKDGEIYFIKAILGGIKNVNNENTQMLMNIGGERLIMLDNPKIGKYSILNMKKKSKVY